MNDAGQGGRRLSSIPDRIVAVAIVEQDDRAGTQLAQRAAPNQVRSWEICVPHPERPAEDLVAEPVRREPDERVPIAVGRAERSRRPAHRIRDRAVGPLELGPDPAWPSPMKFDVLIGVVADLVLRFGNALRDVRVATHVRTHHEERRRDAVSTEDFEDGVGGDGVRPSSNVR